MARCIYMGMQMGIEVSQEWGGGVVLEMERTPGHFPRELAVLSQSAIHKPIDFCGCMGSSLTLADAKHEIRGNTFHSCQKVNNYQGREASTQIPIPHLKLGSHVPIPIRHPNMMPMGNFENW